jgi:hypothetical protein
MMNLPDATVYPAFYGSPLFQAGADTLFTTGNPQSSEIFKSCLNQDKMIFGQKAYPLSNFNQFESIYT